MNSFSFLQKPEKLTKFHKPFTAVLNWYNSLPRSAHLSTHLAVNCQTSISELKRNLCELSNCFYCFFSRCANRTRFGCISSGVSRILRRLLGGVVTRSPRWSWSKPLVTKVSALSGPRLLPPFACSRSPVDSKLPPCATAKGCLFYPTPRGFRFALRGALVRKCP